MFMDEVVFAGVAIVSLCIVFLGGFIYWVAKQNSNKKADEA